MTQNMVPPTVASGSGSFQAVFAGKIIETETEAKRQRDKERYNYRDRQRNKEIQEWIYRNRERVRKKEGRTDRQT